MFRLARAAMIAGAVLLIASSQLMAQRGGFDWTTIGNDAQRSNWLRGDAKISPEVMSKPGFDLLWKAKVNSGARQMQAATPPALIDFYIGYRGFRTLGFFGGTDMVTGIDTDLGRIEWEKKIGGATGRSTVECPGGATSSVARTTNIAFPASGFGRGRGNPAKSDVGEPHEGAVTLKNVRPPSAAPPPPPASANARAGRRQSAPPNVFAARVQYVYALAGDGKLHLMYISNGEEPNPAVPFIPANARAAGLMVFDGWAYVATVNGCGGTEDSIYAMDLESKKVLQWKSPGKIAGTQGFAVAPDGTIFIATGSELVALDSETLQAKGSYKTGGATFTSSPLVFDFKGKNAVAATTNDGKLHIVEASGMVLLGSGDAGVGNYTVGALTSWQETGGSRWILAPSATKLIALKVVDKGGMAALEQGWTSKEMVSPITPSVVNGVTFAISAGKRGTPAILYALDSTTGKEFWSSGQSITSFVTTGGLSAGGGRVYLSTHDGTQYAFGIPMEH